jgi:hypothetical protein
MSRIDTDVLDRALEAARPLEHAQRLVDHVAAVASLQGAAGWPVVARTELSRRLSEHAAALAEPCTREALR